MAEALVNKIIPFSCVDGPGNRTAIFLQGCNFDCKYCHNPETKNVCVNCGECVEKCPTKAIHIVDKKVVYDIEKCCSCDTCIKICKRHSSPKIRRMTPEQAFEEIKKQMPFIRGVTVSGGECTLYPDFIEELFKICKENGLHTLIDSNGTLDFEKYPSLLAVTDGVMLDVKVFNMEEHINVTGVSNEIVLKNATFLAGIGKLYEVRTVVVPDLFNTRETVENTAKLLGKYLDIADIRYKIIAYRPMGVEEKYSHYQVPQKSFLETLADLARNYGFKDIVII